MLFANTFRAFNHHDYFIFWCGPLLGHTGTLIQSTVQSQLLFQLTNSPFCLGSKTFVWGLPRVLFYALDGAVRDRADRKTPHKTNRGQVMALLGLLTRGLVPTGRFPYRLIATAITPLTIPLTTPFMTPFMTH